MYYLRFAFATQPLKDLDSSRVGPYFALRALEKNWDDAIGSPGVDDGGQASIPARARRSPAGGEQGRGLGLLGFDSWA
jgi:hypothetical protein